jgi:hypothetical protein
MPRDAHARAPENRRPRVPHGVVRAHAKAVWTHVQDTCVATPRRYCNVFPVTPVTNATLVVLMLGSIYCGCGAC